VINSITGELPYEKSFLLALYERMLLVRFFEERVNSLFLEGRLHGTAHLCIGEEAAVIGTGFALKEKDYLLATHRGHGQAMGKPLDVNAMMAEMMGKSCGTNGGRGGSMHIADLDKSMLGANGIVGANTPIACGAGLSIKLRGEKDRVVLCYLGDGSFNQGAVHEALNLAAVWGLPVLFACINNCYGMSTPLCRASKETDLKRRAEAYGIRAFEADGNDVLDVYRTVSAARQYVLEFSAPAFIVEHTYRTCGHSKSDKNKYRSQQEIDLWETKNPIGRFADTLHANGVSEEELNQREQNAAAAVAAAVDYATACKPSYTEDLTGLVYAG
jgi:TPP-dependent pyruvate/acetoin dehydrogenase alpha subunit